MGKQGMFRAAVLVLLAAVVALGIAGLAQSLSAPAPRDLGPGLMLDHRVDAPSTSPGAPTSSATPKESSPSAAPDGSPTTPGSSGKPTQSPKPSQSSQPTTPSPAPRTQGPVRPLPPATPDDSDDDDYDDDDFDDDDD